jgi:hypothetical protein
MSIEVTRTSQSTTYLYGPLKSYWDIDLEYAGKEHWKLKDIVRYVGLGLCSTAWLTLPSNWACGLVV